MDATSFHEKLGFFVVTQVDFGVNDDEGVVGKFADFGPVEFEVFHFEVVVGIVVGRPDVDAFPGEAQFGRHVNESVTEHGQHQVILDKRLGAEDADPEGVARGQSVHFERELALGS